MTAGLKDSLDLALELKERGEQFVLATVVRTVSVTAAKAGAKAVILPDGRIGNGWIGGGCARGAVLRAAQAALADGRPRLVSIAPQDLLDELGVSSGEVRDGTEFARNSCPSQGTIDVFIEPVLPKPNLVICGSSPVAVALAGLARAAGFFITAAASAADHASFAGQADRLVDGFAVPGPEHGLRFIVVATQGRGDRDALRAALATDAAYVAFVGSRRKAAALRAQLAAEGVSEERLASFRAPAGLDIGAIAPEEIAVSILAELIAARRSGQRPPPVGA
jgi:xanthine dehydrogenase accessory factor